MPNPSLSTDIETYDGSVCAVFRTLEGPYGALSNFSSDFPVAIGGQIADTTEALYQACRYPHIPDLQLKILLEKTPMGAKRVAKSSWRESRPDWLDVRIEVMRWCIELKVAQHRESFSKQLAATGDADIVEWSYMDHFWGAAPTPEDENVYQGSNMLGKLLMEMRSDLYASNLLADGVVKPPAIGEFRFFGAEVGTIEAVPY